MNKPVLYSYFRSSASYRVRVALHWKEIEYEYQAIHLVKDGGEHNSDSYRAINPMGEVPSFRWGDVTLAQSLPIIEFIEARHPENPLFPVDPGEKAKVREICEHVNAGIHPLQNLKVTQYIAAEFGCDKDRKIAWSHHWIKEGFTGLEKVIAKTAGTYSFGDSVTAADLFIVPQVYNAKRYGVDMAAFPTIAAIELKCLELPAFQKAEPATQKDTPADLK